MNFSPSLLSGPKTAMLPPPPRPPKDSHTAGGLGDSGGGGRRFCWRIFLKLALVILFVATLGFVVAHFLERV